MTLLTSLSAFAEETDSLYIYETKVDTTEIFYLRTNLLSPLTNIGAEYSIDDHWSVAADYYFPWIPRDKSHRNCFQLLGWNIEGRYWFGEDRTYEDRLEGHSAGLSLAAGYYDFERNFKGNQGEFCRQIGRRCMRGYG